MKRSVFCVTFIAGLCVGFSGVAWSVNPTGYGQAGGEYDIRIPRVPSGHLAKAKKVKPPFEATPEILAEGKAIFLGVGGCVSCHGPEGKGDGAAAKNLPIQPRNFTNPKFHKLRTPGELMWILKNGSMGQSGRVPGTGMLPVVQPKGFHYGRARLESAVIRTELGEIAETFKGGRKDRVVGLHSANLTYTNKHSGRNTRVVILNEVKDLVVEKRDSSLRSE